MSDNKLFIGIDTSNYTTSVSLCDNNGIIVANIKKLLDVEHGQRGLRQSDALFLHNKNMPEIMSELRSVLENGYQDRKICAVGYSAYPRDCEGSYMPCFLAGQAVAVSIATAVGCPVYKFSHQAGHVAAALYSCGAEDEISTSSKDGRFAAFHVSGGTTEILLVDNTDGKMTVEQIGGTQDINAGQAIDRAGVMMGMKFPCGREMESLCRDGVSFCKTVKTCVNGLSCNLSGLENQAAKLYAKNNDKREVCEYVFDFVGATLLKMTNNLREQYEDIPVLYAGGVMSNGRIKGILSSNKNVYFAQPEFSSDNAAGIAILCKKKYEK
ncbi:MAG: peptidase M22 [Ruminococcaceae bacterium]|nr:peptidase M22 [Oscillospiraceae bacterium]